MSVYRLYLATCAHSVESQVELSEGINSFPFIYLPLRGKMNKRWGELFVSRSKMEKICWFCFPQCTALRFRDTQELCKALI